MPLKSVDIRTCPLKRSLILSPRHSKNIVVSFPQPAKQESQYHTLLAYRRISRTPTNHLASLFHIYKPVNNLRNRFVRVKDKTLKDKQSNLVYGL